MSIHINWNHVLVYFKMALLLILTVILIACGGGEIVVPGTIPLDEPPSIPASIRLPPSGTLKNKCSQPRSEQPEETPGTLDDEKAYLRSFVDETYLWYKDVPIVNPKNYATPQTYFDALKTNKKTASGRPVDEFHWSVSADSYEQQDVGMEQGYGITWAAAASSPPRNWVVANVQPEGAGRNLKRGDKLMSVDGADFIYGNDTTILNQGLFPNDTLQHTFTIERAGVQVDYILTPADVSTTPVRYAQVLNTPAGKVGYLYFDDHIGKAVPLLNDAFTTFRKEGATNLVLDLRYNGGGYLYIARDLAFMIGGSSTTGKVFEKLVYNDKLPDKHLTLHFSQTSFLDQNNLLPTLNLNTVYILVGAGTASASEAIINGLRGVGVEVVLIGATTRGKPYGFVPQINCGWVYYTVQFKGENAVGFSDYSDGFKPDCSVKDDFSKPLGDPREARFAAALHYLQEGSCPAATGLAAGLRSVGEPVYTVTPNPAKFLMIPH